MSWTLLSPLLITGGSLCIIGLERLWPYDRHQRLFRDGFWLDLVAYGLIQSYVLAFAIGGLVRSIDIATGISRFGLVSDWPIAAQLLFFLVTHDLYIYVFHRAQHSNRWLWRLHEAHHSCRDVDWIAGARSHSLEIMINQTIEFGAMVLLGAHPDVLLMKGVVSALWGMWIHSNVDVRTGPLQYFINGPEMHRWHHARDFLPPGRNFATKLAIWDWLFGTAHRPPGKPAGYGLDEAFPRGYVAQHLHAFRRSS